MTTASSPSPDYERGRADALEAILKGAGDKQAKTEASFDIGTISLLSETALQHDLDPSRPFEAGNVDSYIDNVEDYIQRTVSQTQTIKAEVTNPPTPSHYVDLETFDYSSPSERKRIAREVALDFSAWVQGGLFALYVSGEVSETDYHDRWNRITAMQSDLLAEQARFMFDHPDNAEAKKQQKSSLTDFQVVAMTEVGQRIQGHGLRLVKNNLISGIDPSNLADDSFDYDQLLWNKETVSNFDTDVNITKAARKSHYNGEKDAEQEKAWAKLARFGRISKGIGIAAATEVILIPGTNVVLNAFETGVQIPEIPGSAATVAGLYYVGAAIKDERAYRKYHKEAEEDTSTIRTAKITENALNVKAKDVLTISLERTRRGRTLELEPFEIPEHHDHVEPAITEKAVRMRHAGRVAGFIAATVATFSLYSAATPESATETYSPDEIEQQIKDDVESIDSNPLPGVEEPRDQTYTEDEIDEMLGR